MTHRRLIERALGYWAVQDVEKTLETVSDDIVYQIYAAQTALPFAGETSGRDALQSFLFDILAQFDYLHYESVLLDVQNSVARIQTQYTLRHRESGEQLSGSKRFVCTIRGDLISRIEEYHDAALVAAFMRLARCRVAELAPKHKIPLPLR